MVEERQPRIVEGMRVERAARRGLPDGVAEADLAHGPVVRRSGADRIVVVLRAPADAPPLAITTRLRGAVVHAVFQPTIAKGPRRPPIAWHCVLRLPEGVDADAATTVRIVGLGADVDVELPPSR